VTGRPLIPIAVAGAVSLALPLGLSSFHLDLAITVLILALLASSLDILVGYARLISLGHAAFFGIGAYALALAADKFGIPPLVCLPISILAAMLAAAMVGVLAVRTKGIYFVLITLAFSQVAYFLVHDSAYTGGSDGVVLLERGTYRLGDVTLLNLDDQYHLYYFVLILVAAFLTFTVFLLRSPFGQVIKGIGMNSPRLQSIGFDHQLYSLVAFVIAGAGAGLAGYLFALHQIFADPTLLSWHMSGQILIMVVLGGSGTFIGPLLGALIFTLLEEFLGAYTSSWKLILGIVLVIFVLRVRDGLWPWISALTKNSLRRARGTTS